MTKVFAVAGVGPICGGCLTIVQVVPTSLTEDRVTLRCPRCHWEGTVEKTFTEVALVPPTSPETP